MATCCWRSCIVQQEDSNTDATENSWELQHIQRMLKLWLPEFMMRSVMTPQTNQPTAIPTMYKADPTSTYSHSHYVQDRPYINLQPLPLCTRQTLQPLPLCTRQTLHQPTATPTMYKTDPTATPTMYKTDPTSTYSHSHYVQDRPYINLQPLPLCTRQTLQPLPLCTRQTLHQPTATPTMYKTDPTATPTMYKTDPTSTYSHSHYVQDRPYINLQPLPLCTRQTLQNSEWPGGACSWKTGSLKENQIALSCWLYVTVKSLFLVEFHVFYSKNKTKQK